MIAIHAVAVQALTMLSLSLGFHSALLLLIISTCLDAFYISSHTRLCGWKLDAMPCLDENARRAKHAFLRVAAAILSVPSDVFTTPPMLQPPTQSLEECKHREAVSRVLEKGWNESDGFARTTFDDELALNADGHGDGPDPSTYGEITELGARQLFYYMGINQEQQEDVFFVDLGSGVGKLVVQAFLEVPRLQRAVGVELEPDRHDSASRAWNTIQEEARNLRFSLGDHSSLLCPEATVQFLLGDLFDVTLADATHIYVASLCFTNEMMERIADKLVHEATRIKCVATLKPFPKRFEWRWGKPALEYVEMSWTSARGEGCTVYFYSPLTTTII